MCRSLNNDQVDGDTGEGKCSEVGEGSEDCSISMVMLTRAKGMCRLTTGCLRDRPILA